MKYQIIRNTRYDYAGQSYASVFPNLHRYPATMLPQIGIDALREFNVPQGTLLDPYCGSGSSFASGLEHGMSAMHGYDINPLAVLISKVRFTYFSEDEMVAARRNFRNAIFEFLKDETAAAALPRPNITNIDYWFSKEVANMLATIKHFIATIENENIRDFFLIAFSETIRDCSYTRNNEFKLFRMKPEDLLNFNPDVLSVFFKKLDDAFTIYQYFYLPKLKKQTRVDVRYSEFQLRENYFDAVLTSPPYGDSRTTVAYGQFSTLSNEWFDIGYARKIDAMLMGGMQKKETLASGLMSDYIAHVSAADARRAQDVSSFYLDLGKSIAQVAASVKKGGKAIYVVGNRRVKNIVLPTDQFIAEQFEANGFRHLITYERALSSKSMPSRNSPTNEPGKTANTMLSEYIVACEKQ
jgi:DNA modification methylase